MGFEVPRAVSSTLQDKSQGTPSPYNGTGVLPERLPAVSTITDKLTSELQYQQCFLGCRQQGVGMQQETHDPSLGS